MKNDRPTGAPLDIVIATSGRFHALDMARELGQCGHRVVLFSDLPARRVGLFGLAPRTSRSFFPFTLPFIALSRFSRFESVREAADRAGNLFRDRWVSALAPRCDVFIGMAGIYTRAGRVIQQKHQALWVVERGSRHALSQKAILEGIPGWPAGRPGMPDFYVHRNLREYEQADVISVPARHVADSFEEQGVPPSKLFRNPYGVDLSMFPPTPARPKGPPVVLYVGAWSLQKGVDVLLEAFRRLPGFRLMHVGSVGDGPPFPREPWFTHEDTVPQGDLKDWYARADLFAQASRQDGLSLVQAQALACGLPLVCTDRTGGADLGEMIPDREMVTVVPHDDPGAMAVGLKKAAEKAARMTGLRDGLGPARAALSWSAYGQRYSDFLVERTRRKPT